MKENEVHEPHGIPLGYEILAELKSLRTAREYAAQARLLHRRVILVWNGSTYTVWFEAHTFWLT